MTREQFTLIELVQALLNRLQLPGLRTEETLALRIELAKYAEELKGE